MHAINLFSLTRVTDPQVFTRYEQVLSGRTDPLQVRSHEQHTLRSLTDRLSEDTSLPFRCLDGFFFSYVIMHIGKEFDLLKIAADRSLILNIELKSEAVPEEKIRAQLAQNRYYLSHITARILSFTYVAETGTLYRMNDRGRLRTSDMDDLREALMRSAFEDFVVTDIDALFAAHRYLISPLELPEKFLLGEYFLTNQQDTFRGQILEILKEPLTYVLAVTGVPGTGKTLLLFDLAMALSARNQVVLLSGGALCDAHRLIDGRTRNIRIYGYPELSAKDRDRLFDAPYLLIDDTNAIPGEDQKALIQEAVSHGVSCLMTADAAAGPLAVTPDRTFALTGRIRINRSIAAFLKRLVNQNQPTARMEADAVSLLFAASDSDVDTLLAAATETGAHYLAFPDEGRPDREYRSVVTVLGPDLYYDGFRHLHLSEDEDENEALCRSLTDLLAAAREHLTVIVRENTEFFSDLLCLL